MPLKARKNYKKTVEQKEKELVEQYTKDMTKKTTPKKPEKSENDTWLEQCLEFETFLTEAISKNKPFGFLVDMHKRLIEDGYILTDNMVKAVRKCIKREEEWKKEREQKASEPQEVRSITLKIKPFIMKDLGIDSRVITGNVKAETGKAWLIEGKADMLASMSFCARCGRQLNEPASQITGFGEVCAGKAGIPYDKEGVLGMTKRQRTAIRKKFLKKLNNQTFERWIPKSQAEEMEDPAK